MIEFHPKYIIDRNQNKQSVILSIREWKQIMAVMEELDDIESYDSAKKVEEEVIPFEQAMLEIDSSL
uniref:Antitoxin n=1 Tax=Candidatus Kentrum sp. TUN TaxID=2126343 RepID=A0A450ZG68_9GAMM|nr:MAG: hypothetical protein BECKTUN1418F_GA0071002_101321 [Candidatus Kentron sp. TUN]VFK53372.1 MAG: hypothetical protein BECKTUN1418E_GA0071001_101521 [Candidatus Kentron sp. TUN]